MGILRADRITGLGGANAIKGSVLFSEKQYFIINNHEDFQFGTGDWTIEYWWNGHPNGGYNSVITTMITSNESGTWRVGHTFSGNNRIYFARGTGSGFTDVTFDVDVNDNKWHHIAFVRSSGTIIPFVDGVDKTATKATGSVSDGNNMTTTNRVIIGFNDRDNDYIHGHVSNLRVVKGTALYTSNFTPPTGELGKVSGTSLLCFQSPSDILQEETGKILQPFRDGTSSGDQAGLNSTYAVATRFTPNTPVGFSTTTDVGSQYGTTFDGFTVFATSTYIVPPSGNTRERNRGRAVLGGGYESAQSTDMQFFEVQSQGNTLTFGDLTQARWIPAAYASSTRACFAGGGTPSRVNTIDFVTIATTSNATNFGDLTSTRTYFMGYSSSTRGIAAGGGDPNLSDVIDYVTIATTGDATDFGNLTVARQEVMSACSPTRGLTMGGFLTPNPSTNVVDYVTIATTGDATDFGDMTAGSGHGAATSDNTRAIFAGGYSPGTTYTKKIEFFTTASTGNGTDFGDLITAVITSYGMPSDNTRGVLCGGYVQPTNINSMQQITIQSTGDAVDFGDVTVMKRGNGGTSDSHGGLS